MNDGVWSCADCQRAHRRAGRLCVDHFAEFLGWLSAAPRSSSGWRIETWYWAAVQPPRSEFIGLFVMGRTPAQAVKTLDELIVGGGEVRAKLAGAMGVAA